MASLGATVIDAQQLAAGDQQQSSAVPLGGAALEDEAPGATLDAANALLESIRKSVVERKVISQVACRPNVNYLETTLNKAEKHLKDAVKLYEEAQIAHSCAQKDLEILALAMRLQQQEPDEDERVRNGMMLLLQKLKTESDNLISGAVEPAMFVIRTAWTYSDVSGNNRRDWIGHAMSGEVLQKSTRFQKLIPLLRKAIALDLTEIEYEVELSQYQNLPHCTAPPRQTTVATATAALQQPPPPQQLVNDSTKRLAPSGYLRKTMKAMSAIFRSYLTEIHMGAHLCNVEFHDQCVVPPHDEPDADARDSGVSRWKDIDSKFACKYTRAAINALNNPSADDVEKLLESHCFKLRQHLQNFPPDLPLVTWTTGRRIKSDELKKICEALVTLDLGESKNIALQQCWDEYNQNISSRALTVERAPPPYMEDRTVNFAQRAAAAAEAQARRMAEAAAAAAAAHEAARGPVPGSVLVDGRWTLKRITVDHDVLKAICGRSLSKNWSVYTNSTKSLRNVPVAPLWNALIHYGGIHLAVHRNLLKVVLRKAIEKLKVPSDILIRNVESMIKVHFHGVYAYTQEEELDIREDYSDLLLEGQSTQRIECLDSESTIFQIAAKDATRDEIMGALISSKLPSLPYFDGFLLEDQFFDVETVWAQAAHLGGVKQVLASTDMLKRFLDVLLSTAPATRSLPLPPYIMGHLRIQLTFLKPICGVTDGAGPSTTPHHTNAGGLSSSSPHFNTGGAAGVLAQLGGRPATTHRRVTFEEGLTAAPEAAMLGRRKRYAPSAYREYFVEQIQSLDDEAAIDEYITAKRSRRNAPKALSTEYIVEYESSDDDGGDDDEVI